MRSVVGNFVANNRPAPSWGTVVGAIFSHQIEGDYRVTPRQIAATKRGTGWATCELYPVADVRTHIRRDVAAALANRTAARAWKLPMPAEIEVEFAYSALADPLAAIPGVRRPHARTVAWKIPDARFIYNWPSADWHPPA